MTEPVRLSNPGATVDTLLTTLKNSNLSATHKITRSATIVVAASDSSAKSKAQADYVCDGIDDQVEIQAAIDALTSGGTIHFLTGKYRLAAEVSVTHPIILEGDSLSAFDGGSSSVPGIVLYTTTGGTEFYLSDNSNCNILSIASSGVSLKSITINGNSSAQSAGHGVHITHQTPELVEIKIINCQIINCKGSGVYDEGWRSTVEDTFIGGCDIGINMTAVGHMHVWSYGNHIVHNRIGIYSPRTTGMQRHWICYGNSISYNADEGIKYGGLSAGIVDNIIFLNGKDGIYIDNIIDDISVNRIIGNYVENNVGNGITVMSMAIINSNYVKSNTMHGVLVNGRGNLIQNNVILFNDSNQTNTYDGINLSAGTAAGGRNNIIIGNTVSANNRYEIYSVDAANAIYENYIGAKSMSLGAAVKLFKNTGYVTENTGTATITASATTVNVSHGLAAAPTRVLLSPTTATAGKQYYVSAKAATTFTITIDSAAEADISFDWQAVI